MCPLLHLWNDCVHLGKGEKVTPLRPMGRSAGWCLVKPRLSVSTGKIFQEVDLDQLHHPDIQELSDCNSC